MFNANLRKTEIDNYNATVDRYEKIAKDFGKNATTLYTERKNAVGLSAAGITSGLATAGAIVEDGMVAGVGVFVLAAPVAGLAAAGVRVHLKNKQLRQEKERLYKESLKKHEAIIRAMKAEADADKERMDYLQSLNILLQQAIKDLQYDLGVA